jgi:hypothetical protein
MKCPHCQKSFEVVKKPKRHRLTSDGKSTLCGYHVSWHMLEIADSPDRVDCANCLKELPPSKYPRRLDAGLYAKNAASKI